jgi:hypothetical protein
MSMFERLGHLLVRRKKEGLALFLIGIILSGVFAHSSLAALMLVDIQIQRVILTKSMSISEMT